MTDEELESDWLEKEQLPNHGDHDFLVYQNKNTGDVVKIEYRTNIAGKILKVIQDFPCKPWEIK
jgi:DNA-directed RNA polymerase subunit H (RpoH/RPB5)